MSEIVIYQPFPQERYELLQQLSNQQGLRIAKYKNKKQQIDYLVFTHTFKQLPKNITAKITKQIQQFNDYQESCLSNANKAYIHQSIQEAKISLRVRSRFSKTLQTAIRTNKYTPTVDQKIEHLLFLSQVLREMHISGHTHGCIRLSNIFYRVKKSELTLGMPVYIQIQKWKIREAEIRQKNGEIAHLLKSKQWQRPSFPSDIFSLGVVFLQMWLNQQLPQILSKTDAQVHLLKLNHPTFQYIIRKMIAQSNEQFKINDVVEAIENWRAFNPPSMIFEPEPENIQLLCFYLFRVNKKPKKANPKQIAQSLVLVSKKFDVGTAIFTFVNDICLLNLVFFQGNRQLLFDISQQVKRATNNIKDLDLLNFKQILNHQNTKIRLTKQGYIQIRFISKRQKQPIPRKQSQMPICEPFSKVCHIIHGDTLRSGCIIGQHFVITSARNLKELREHEKHLIFQSPFHTFSKIQNEENYDVWDASEVTGIDPQSSDNFCLICFNPRIVLDSFNKYLKLIKNYSQVIMQEKINEFQQKGICFSYQLGGSQLKKGSIFFNSEYFQLNYENKDIKTCNFLSGQPLVINFSSGICAVIGLYTYNGIGRLFTDQFYWALYRIILKNVGEDCIIKESCVSHIFIQCKQFDVKQGEIQNMHLRYISKDGKISSNLISKIKMLKQNNKEPILELGYYDYILFIYYQQAGNPGKSIQHLKKAGKYYCQFYKGKDNFIYAYIHYILGIFLSRQSKQQNYDDMMYFRQSAAGMLMRNAYNPFLLCFCLKHITNSQQYWLHDMPRYQTLCMSLGYIKQLREMYESPSKFIKNGGQLDWKSYQKEKEKLKTYNFYKVTFNYQRFIKRTYKAIQLCDENSLYLYLVQDRLDQLHVRHQNDGKDQQRQNKLRQLWKSSLATFMKNCTNLKQIEEFEIWSKKFYEDGHYIVKGTFSEKKDLIKQNNLLSYLTL